MKTVLFLKGEFNFCFILVREKRQNQLPFIPVHRNSLFKVGKSQLKCILESHIKGIEENIKKIAHILGKSLKSQIVTRHYVNKWGNIKVAYKSQEKRK